MSAQTNPLLQAEFFPPFGRFTPEQAEQAVEFQIDQNRREIEALLADEPEGAEQTLRRLESIDDRLNQIWSPISHLNSVCNSDALRAVYERCLEKLSAYSTDMGQHQGLFACYQRIRESAEFNQLSNAQQAAMEQALRDFRLAGIDLPKPERERFKAIKARLSVLSNQFSNHVLDATAAWTYHTEQQSDLAGLPEHALAQAAEAARSRDLSGWVLTLDFPSYHAVMTYADSRELREQVYKAYGARASEFGDESLDNSPLMVEILALRAELAQLLGYANYAELSLEKKMAGTPAEVVQFLQDLARESRPVAERELQLLQDYAEQSLGLQSLQPWDIAYVSEKYKQQTFSLSQEMLRPYFPAHRVLEGMFEVVHKLYGISIVAAENIATWHSDVKVFEIREKGQTIAWFYLDLYARQKKRGGAWMDECRVRRATESGLQRPIAYLTCNFTPPVGDTPSLLTFDEVTTLFHEFGHGLHHMLTRVDVAAVSGINGVAWDAVELPSQFMENWCWQKSVIPLISGHYQTGQPLPETLLEKLLQAKHFNAGLFMVRQLEFALFDFKLHLSAPVPTADEIQQLLEQVRAEVAVVQPPADYRFQNSFSHIFAGGYAAGYYSYKWAEVLSADAFSLFEQQGIFDEVTGARFRDIILANGGAEEASELFEKFRGRAPSIEPLLRHSGIRSAQ